jgi:hypothetical protein
MQVQPAVVTPVRYVAFQDKISAADWRVEAIDSKAGDVFVAIFSGPLAEERAVEYAKFKSQ